MAKIEIYDPPRDGLLDVKVHGYIPDSDEHIVNAYGTTVHVPASLVSIAPEDDDYEHGDDWVYNDDAWEGE